MLQSGLSATQDVIDDRLYDTLIFGTRMNGSGCATHRDRGCRTGGNAEFVKAGTILTSTDIEFVSPFRKLTIVDFQPFPRTTSKETVDHRPLGIVNFYELAVIVVRGTQQTCIYIIGGGFSHGKLGQKLVSLVVRLGSESLDRF